MQIIKKNRYLNKYTVIYKDIVLQSNNLEYILFEMFEMIEVSKKVWFV